MKVSPRPGKTCNVVEYSLRTTPNIGPPEHRVLDCAKKQMKKGGAARPPSSEGRQCRTAKKTNNSRVRERARAFTPSGLKPSRAARHSPDPGVIRKVMGGPTQLFRAPTCLFESPGCPSFVFTPLDECCPSPQNVEARGPCGGSGPHGPRKTRARERERGRQRERGQTNGPSDIARPSGRPPPSGGGHACRERERERRKRSHFGSSRNPPPA